jgi:hypothetical protein
MDNITILPYEHVNFSIAANKDKSLADFIAHESHVGLNPEQLKEAHTLIVEAAKPKPAIQEKIVEPTEKTEDGSIAVQPGSFVVRDSEIHLIDGND